MSKKVIKIRDGDQVPEGGKYLSTKSLPDEEKAYLSDWQHTPQLSDWIPVIGYAMAREHRRVITPNATFHFYEVMEEE